MVRPPVKLSSVLPCVVGWLMLSSTVLGQQSGSALDTAKRLLDAFNRHDPAAMAALVDPRFELIYVSEDGLSEIAARGPAELERQMTAYFRAQPSVRSEIEGSIGGSRFVAFRERPQPTAERPERRPSSLAVYEVVDGKIRRAWYYPAEGG